MRASGRSILLITRITGSRASSALRRTKRVCGSGPSEASTSSKIPSTIVRPRSTSPPKSACPGVSTMFSLTPLWRTAVFFARIVMPFSRSRSIESMTRSATSWFWRKAPDCQSMASTSVVLPWSTWATIATLRRSSRTAMRQLKLAAGLRSGACCGRGFARNTGALDVALALEALGQTVLMAGFILARASLLLALSRVLARRLRVLLAEAERCHVSSLAWGRERLDRCRGGPRGRERVCLTRPQVDQIRITSLPGRRTDRCRRVVDLRIRARRVRVLVHEAVANTTGEPARERACQRGRSVGGDGGAVGLRRPCFGCKHERGARGCCRRAGAEGGRDVCSCRDAARGHKRDIRHRPHRLEQLEQRDQRLVGRVVERAAVPAGLAALDDQYVGVRGRCLLGLRRAGDRQPDLAARDAEPLDRLARRNPE